MIVGITGKYGAGKGVVVDILKKKGFTHYSARDFINEELVRRGLVANRDNLIKVANDLREKNGAHYVAEQLYLRAKKKGGDAVIDSIRVVAEVEYLSKLDGYILIAVDADRDIRYDRIVHRGLATDNVTFEDFCKKEDLESNNVSGDKNKQDLNECLRLSDFIVENNGTFVELEINVNKVLDNAKFLFG